MLTRCQPSPLTRLSGKGSYTVSHKARSSLQMAEAAPDARQEAASVAIRSVGQNRIPHTLLQGLIKIDGLSGNTNCRCIMVPKDQLKHG